MFFKLQQQIKHYFNVKNKALIPKKPKNTIEVSIRNSSKRSYVFSM